MFHTVDEHIKYSLAEDIKDEDHSGASCIPSNAISEVELLIKEEGILAGVDVAKKVFKQLQADIHFAPFLKDGDKMTVGDVAFRIKGNTRALLKGERLALNYMQRMSGIATLTAEYVSAVAGSKAKILDTRKTSPGLRVFEKMAVKIGGGHNHRMGLYDMIMIKDNHIDFAGGIDHAMNRVAEYQQTKNLNLAVEVEARNLAEVEQILSNGKATRVMFDNFNYQDTKRGVEMVSGRLEIESSGGIDLTTVKKYADCGVDFISVGALTHQIKSLDMSLKATN